MYDIASPIRNSLPDTGSELKNLKKLVLKLSLFYSEMHTNYNHIRDPSEWGTLTPKTMILDIQEAACDQVSPSKSSLHTTSSVKMRFKIC